MPTITTRLTFAYTAVFALIIAAVMATIYMRFAADMQDDIDAELRSYTDFVLSEIGSPGRTLGETFAKMQSATTEASLRFRSMRLVLLDEDTVIYERSRRVPIQDLLDTLSAGGALRRGYRSVKLRGIPCRAFSRTAPFDSTGNTAMVVVTSLENYTESVDQMEVLLALSALFALLAAGAGGWLIARRALAPVASMTTAAAQISSSNLDRRVPVGRSHDELSMLAGTFNDMIERLQQSFESQRRFIADASHDIRTPIAVIRGELELLQRRIKGEPPTRDALDRAIAELDRLNQLANDLLLLARAEAGQLPQARQQERLDELLAESASSLRRLASQKDVAIKVDIYDAAEVRCDPQMLRRAVSNLIENAIKFSPASMSVRTSLFVTGRRASIVIIDRGEGIPPKDLPRIFDRFYRGDRSRGHRGTGLGLTIAKAIIEDHGGTVHIASELGVGTTITVTLPVILPAQYA
ncbi:MAG TPA: ATP-binding protein [Candidatus Kapabacteria bacterium]|nr:ATP-binding protein [Candidatus Kapabacteria bacterium]